MACDLGLVRLVDTFGLRKTAHVFGAGSLDLAHFTYQFSEVFNGHTFHQFLQFLEHLVDAYAPRKVSLIVDNGPCHWLDEAGEEWPVANPALAATFERFQSRPDLIAAQVARFR